jgi:hypothetical protein
MMSCCGRSNRGFESQEEETRLDGTCHDTKETVVFPRGSKWMARILKETSDMGPWVM